MGAYVIRRILIALLMLIGASLLGFGVMKLTPGTYFDLMKMNPRISQDLVDRQIARYGLDRPVHIQYLRWLNELLPFGFKQTEAGGYVWRVRQDGSRSFNWPTPKWPNMGESFEHQAPVWQVLSRRLGNTLLLNVVAIALTWMVAIPLGTYAALHQHRLPDLVLSGISFVGMSLPGFFLALILLWLAAGVWDVLPAGGLKSATYDDMSAAGKVLDIAWHLVIPGLVLTIGGLAGLQRITRGNMLEVLRQQYVTTARAKGLPESRVIYRHALRNAINPLITIFGYELAALFSGAALLEIVLNYPGMGQLMYQAIVSKDEPLVMAGFMIGAVLLLLGNLIADLLLAVADPRISYS